MPNLCGVNQKLLAEALLVIKSQKSAAKSKNSSSDVLDTNKTDNSDRPTRSEMPLPEPPNQTEIEAVVSVSKVFKFMVYICFQSP